jgi:hypothetical protein
MLSQQLYANNVSVNIGDSLAARTKDPLWFLARQWQTGEFEAENGGSLSAAYISFREHPLSKLKRGTTTQTVSLDTPLDALVEGETASGVSPAWSSEALAYGFGLETASHRLQATDYFGKGLDWFHFDLASATAPSSPLEVTERRVVPAALQFRGMPHPKWWRFEDGNADFERPDDPEPNILATLLPEFVVIDSNNWYLMPLKQTAGTIREITSVKVMDGFGVITEIGPSDRGSWRLFSLSGTARASNNGALLFIPNIALDVLDNDEMEDIVLLRDEDANLVWAVERLYLDPNGEQVHNGDRTDFPVAVSSPGRDDRPRYRFSAEVPRHWIPYVPRFLGAAQGDTYLRRGRTDEAATLQAPQYHTRIVAESWRLREEEIPRSGVRVRRTRRFARGSDGVGVQWVGRSREAASRLPAPGLRFDFLEERAAVAPDR